MKCEFGSCNKQGVFAIYELLENGKKRWWSNLCPDHDTLIARNNRVIKHQYPDLKFNEIG